MCCSDSCGNDYVKPFPVLLPQEILENLFFFALFINIHIFPSKQGWKVKKLIIRYLLGNKDKKRGSHFHNYLIQRAENGTQTRDPQLGRLVLYRLSYFRKMVGSDGFEPPKATPAELQSAPFGHSGNCP